MSTLLSIGVDRSSPRSMTCQIRDAIRDRVRDGTLRPGARLPSTRHLAGDLGVSRSVAVQAYEQLIAEGYLRAAQGSGTRVATHLPTVTTLTPPPAHTEPARFDLRPDATSTALFPGKRWLAAYQSAVRLANRGMAPPPPAAGLPELRAELAGYLGRARGVVAEQVVVTGGAADSLGLAGHLLHALGATHVGVETPGDQRLARGMTRTNLGIVPIPVDDDGIDVAALARSGARAVLVTPVGQLPTGAHLSAARRAALVAWADEFDGWIIEHDPDGHLWLGGATAPLALQRDHPARVIYTGSTMGLCGPHLRLGWLAGTRALLTEVAATPAAPDALNQLAFADFISRGLLDAHVRELRDTFRARRAALHRAVAHHLPTATVCGGEAGAHSYLRLPPDVDDLLLADHARDDSVLVHPVRRYHLGRRTAEPALVIGYRAVGRHRIAEAVQLLSRAARRSRHPLAS